MHLNEDHTDLSVHYYIDNSNLVIYVQNFGSNRYLRTLNVYVISDPYNKKCSSMQFRYVDHLVKYFAWNKCHHLK